MSIKNIIRGVFFVCFVTAAFLFIAAALVYFGAFDEKTANIVAFAGMAAGGFIGAFTAAKSSDSKLLANALCVSLICSVIVLMGAFLLGSGFAVGIRTVSVIAGLFCTGFLGALFGR